MEASLEAPNKNTKGINAKVVAAREAYLYGTGSGKPVRDTRKLSELTGLHVNTVRKWLPTWQKESEQLVANTCENSLALHLSAEVLEQGRKDTETMRAQVDLLASQLTAMKSILKLLEDCLHNFDDNKDYALRLFENFINGAGSRASILNSYLKVQIQWAKAAGLEAYTEVQVTGAKALVSQRAKMEAKDEGGPDDGETGEVVGFKRRG